MDSQAGQSVLVAAGEDRVGRYKIFGISNIAVKVSSLESKDLFAVEIILRERGGPGKHFHYEQDEWFYIIEGEFLFEAGTERFRLNPGDSLFVPRMVPHVWAFVGETQGRMLATVTPAGELEAFFENAAKNKALPGPDQSLWRPYGMEWVGPPLEVG